MSDVNEQITQIKATSNRITTAQLRQVIGGFVVACTAQYQDKVTKGTLMSEQAEGVASTVEQAATMAVNYINTGDFAGTPTTV